MKALAPDVIARYAKIAGDEYGVPPSLVAAVVMHESSGRPGLRGKAGEYGLMQLMPATADTLGFSGDYALLLSHPLLNMRLGTKYLAQQFRRYGNWPEALSAYNAGHAIKSNLETYARPILAMANMGGPAAAGGLLVLSLGLAFLAFSRTRS